LKDITMSYWIEHQAIALVLPMSESGLDEDRFVVAIEGGSNNLTNKDVFGRERPVRDWYIGMVGTTTQVLRQTVKAAACCEGYELRVGDRPTTPETYIRRTRRLLKAARADFRRHVSLSLKVEPSHALVAPAAAAGFTIYPYAEYGGKQFAKLIPPAQSESGWAQFFQLTHSLLESGDIDPSRFGEVWGLPQS
jgi:hypothetical protein